MICPNCDGVGRKAGSTRTCWPCRGTGEVDRVINEIVHDDDVVKK